MTPTGSAPVGVFAFREDVMAEQDRKSVKRTTRMRARRFKDLVSRRKEKAQEDDQ
jgi:hypothetical protein